MPLLFDLARNRHGFGSGDVVSCVQAAHRSVHLVHVEPPKGSPARVRVEPYAFYDEPVPAEVLAAVSDALRLHDPERIAFDVCPSWRHVPAPAR